MTCKTCAHWEVPSHSWIKRLAWRNDYGVCKWLSLSYIDNQDKEANVGAAFAACEAEGGYESELYTRPEFSCSEYVLAP